MDRFLPEKTVDARRNGSIFFGVGRGLKRKEQYLSLRCVSKKPMVCCERETASERSFNRWQVKVFSGG